MLIGDTRWGRCWAVQVAGIAAGLVAAAVLRRRPGAGDPDPPRGWGVAMCAPAVAALVAVSAASHAASGTDAGIVTGIDAIHLLATAAWFGGLLGLILVVPAAHRRLSEPDGTRLAAAIVVRFSGLAIACVGVLVVTGVYRAIGELSAVGDLLNTSYGQALAIKVGLFALLLASGAYNRLVLHPRLERAALGLRDSDGGAAERLRVSVLTELVLAAALLGAVAVLVSLPPP
jgi:putative copper export protein